MDFSDPQFPAHVWLMIFYGLLDSMWQTTAYWFMGAMSNDPAKLAVFTGFCKILLGSQAAVPVLMLLLLLQTSASSLLDQLLFGASMLFKNRRLNCFQAICRHHRGFFLRRYMDIFISTWVLAAAGMICAIPLVYVRVKDRTEMDDEAL